MTRYQTRKKVIYIYDELTCPNCGEEMHIESWEEDRGEYQGFPCKERVCRLVCEECGYIEE